MDAATIISAIGGLWKLFAVLLLFFVVFHWRNDWPDLLRNLYVRWKWGQAEAEFRRQAPQSEEKISTTEAQVALPAPSSEPETKAPAVEKEIGPVAVQGEPDDYMAMLIGFWDKNETAAVEAYKRLQSAETDPIERLKNEARYFYMRFYHLADLNALSALEKLSKNADAKREAHYWLGVLYQDTDADKAIINFEKAAATANSEMERARAVIGAARSIYQLNQKRGFLRIIRQIAQTKDSKALRSYFLELGKLYERSENHSLRAIAFEKALEVVPSDTDALFSAAYSYSEKEFYLISTLHYEKLLELSPDNADAWNNLGVGYRELKMPIRSTSSYQRSAELNETLAMANLAFAYMNAGFTEDAQRILEDAKGKENVHPNIGRAMARLADKKEEEKKIEARVLDNARAEQRFLRAFGEAYFQVDSNCPSFNGKWQSGKDIELEIVQRENDLTGTWTIKAAFLLFSTNEKSCSFRGEANNRGATISVTEGESLIAPSVGKGYAYLSPDGQRLFALTMKDAKHTMVEFARSS